MIKKISIKDWPNGLYRIEGQVTTEDVIVGELEEIGDEHYMRGEITLELHPDIKKVLGYEERPYKNYGKMLYDDPMGSVTLVADASCGRDSDRASKMMKTRYAKDRDLKLSKEAVSKGMQRLVEWANRDIERVNENFSRVIAQNVIHFKWDAQDTIDELDGQVKELREKIKEINRQRREIVKKELKEWMDSEGIPEELQEDINKESCFDKHRRPFY